MLTYRDNSLEIQKISPEERKKQERMRDVLLLLQQLVEREEVTLKLIIDCLYDVGAINLANKKLTNKPLNRIMKAIARLLKPAFRRIALIWVKKNLPTLVTDWLETQVSFNK
ncbi:MAG: hypothetical protein Tsb0014_40560 [Pleurocapsa sp.]